MASATFTANQGNVDTAVDQGSTGWVGGPGGLTVGPQGYAGPQVGRRMTAAEFREKQKRKRLLDSLTDEQKSQYIQGQMNARVRLQEIQQTYDLKTSLEEKKRFSRAQSMFRIAQRSGRFNDEQMDSLGMDLVNYAIGLPKDLIEKTEQQKQTEAWAADGKGVGMQWTDEMGNRVTREPDGKQVVQVPYYRTPEYQNRENQIKREQFLGEQRQRLFSETNPDGSRVYDNESVEKLLEDSYPFYKQQKDQQRSIDAENERIRKITPWWVHATQAGLPVEASDVELPPSVGQAKVVLRAMYIKYNGSPPPKESPEYPSFAEARKIILLYNAQEKNKFQESIKKESREIQKQDTNKPFSVPVLFGM